MLEEVWKKSGMRKSSNWVGQAKQGSSGLYEGPRLDDPSHLFSPVTDKVARKEAKRRQASAKGRLAYVLMGDKPQRRSKNEGKVDIFVSWEVWLVWL